MEKRTMNDLKKVRSSFLILVSLFILTLSFSMASATMRQEDGMVKELPLPEIPEELSTREQKMTYLLNHFWDAMDWDDPALKTDSLFLEQNLSNFFSVLALADSVSGQSGVNTLLNKVRQDPELSETIAGLAETYLYIPSTPFSNS